MPTQIPFGRKGHSLLSIEEVSSGLACKCVCPECGGKLVAKKGNRHAHHFAHYRKTDCSGALETTLHLKAKSILARRKVIAVPPLYLHRQLWPLSKAQLIQFERVACEQYAQGFTPDLTMVKGSKRLFVEIAVTHAVDVKKQRQMRRLRTPVLEINVLDIYVEVSARGQLLTTALLEHELVHGLVHKQWLFNPKKEGIEYGLRKRAAVKPARHSLYRGYHNYYVRDCPLEKRIKQRPPTPRQAYANVLQDCTYCHRCLEIQYQTAWVGFREVPQVPMAVVCWGHLEVPKVGEWWSAV